MKHFEQQHIIVTGDLMLDHYTYGNTQRVSPEAPCMVLSRKSEQYSLGGAANVARYLNAFGARVSLFGLAGNDPTGIRLKSCLAESGIDATILPAPYTTEKHRIIAAPGRQLLRVDNDSNATLSPDDIKTLVETITKAHPAAVILSDYNKGMLSASACRAILDGCLRENIPTIVDIKAFPFDKYRSATIVKGNRPEMMSLAHTYGLATDSIPRLLAEISRILDCKYTVMTDGADGIHIDSPEGYTHCTAMPAKVCDVTGAGDIVTAFLALCLMPAGVSITEAAEVAAEVAAIKISTPGTDVVTPMQLRARNKILSAVEELPSHTLRGVTVFTNGCFDILHPGHIELLRRARSYGDTLVVGLNTDASVRRLKGDGRPVNNLRHRAQMLAALQYVDYVIPFADDTPSRLIRSLNPDVLVKGGDYTPETIVGADYVLSRGGRVAVVPLVPGESSTAIINACRL